MSYIHQTDGHDRYVELNSAVFVPTGVVIEHTSGPKEFIKTEDFKSINFGSAVKINGAPS